MTRIHYKLFIPILLGMVAGAGAGYLYYHFIGCNGSCLIASSPFISTIYGTIMGGLTVNLFRKKKVEEKAI